MTDTPRLIEHAFPLKQTSLDSAHEKNMRQGYWFYVVYDCATPNPRLVRVQDPFESLLAKSKGSVLISAKEIGQAARGG